MSEVTITSTSEARQYAQSLQSDTAFYNQLVNDLMDVKTQIVNNWEGDSADINDIIVRIDSVNSVFSDKIIPALSGLYTSVDEFSDEIDLIASQTVESGGATVSGDSGKEDHNNIFGGAFWKNIGEDFTDDWDYSDTRGIGSAIGNTVQGVVNTAGSVVNTVVRVIGGVFGSAGK